MVKDMDYVINGELYIRKKVEKFNAEKILKQLEEEIEDLEFETITQLPDYKLFDELEIKRREKEFYMEIDGEDDYDYMDSFYQLSTDETTFELHSIPDNEDIREYGSMQKVKDDFISLSDFLSKGKYVGKAFYRTKPTVYNGDDFDTKYLKSRLAPITYIVLYSFNDIFLVLKKSDITNRSVIEIADSRYTKDGNYEFFGDVTHEYEDKKELYKEIVNQCNNMVRDNKKNK